MTEPFHGALILTGPTGAGKTQLGIELAQRLGAEIVSMDSMALYRGMDIGTAKPTPTQMKLVPHHLIDVLDPCESASVAWWLAQSARCCREIKERGKRPLIVGGTPLYLKALLRGLFDGPGADEAVRQRLEQDARETGSAALHHRLADVDPPTAERIHPNDVRRIIRALEVHELTGKPISEWQKQWENGKQKPEVRRQKAEGSGRDEIELRAEAEAAPSVHCVLPSAFCLLPSAYWLDVPREKLYEQINRRVEEMFAGGLVDEVRRLRELPRPVSREAGQALGYKEVLRHLDGCATLPETIVEVQTRSRHFAKRQISWFRQLPEVQPITWELTRALWGLTMNR